MKPFRRGQAVMHCRTGQRFKIVAVRETGNMSLDRLRLRPVRKNGSMGRPVTRIAAYYCPVR